MSPNEQAEKELHEMLYPEETAKEDAPEKKELTEQQKALLMKVRKNPNKFLRLMRRRRYFSEENIENVFVNMLNSGTGRKGRRNLAKLLKIDWKTFREMEDTLIEMYPDRLTEATKRGIIERYTRLFHEKKITKTRLNRYIDSLTNNKPLVEDETETEETPSEVEES